MARFDYLAWVNLTACIKGTLRLDATANPVYPPTPQKKTKFARIQCEGEQLRLQGYVLTFRAGTLLLSSFVSGTVATQHQCPVRFVPCRWQVHLLLYMSS